MIGNGFLDSIIVHKLNMLNQEIKNKLIIHFFLNEFHLYQSKFIASTRLSKTSERKMNFIFGYTNNDKMTANGIFDLNHEVYGEKKFFF
jgi:hypothetical protein